MSARTSRHRGLAAWLGRILAAAAAGYLGYVTVEGSRRLVRPEVRPFLPEEEGGAATPADIGLEYEEVRFTTTDGVTLSGWLMPAARETRCAVVLLHGFTGHRLPQLIAFVPWLRERYHVLQFDFRGHGESEDAPITLGSSEQLDVAAAVHYLSGRGLGPIALMGISMGASVAIMAAPDLPVAAVVADAPYAELHVPVASRMRELGYPLARIGARLVVAAASLRARIRLRSPISRVAGVAPRGLLLVAPREDRLIPWTQSVRLFERAGEPKELFVVEGAEHAEAHAVAPDAYKRRVLQFLERHLEGVGQ